MVRGARRSLRNLPLHRMGKSFQLKYLKQQCDDILDCLDDLIRQAREDAPLRESGFRLKRYDRGKPSDPRGEAALERKLWASWTSWKKGDPPFIPDRCLFLQSYQVPLRRTHKDKSWGEVDLLGVDPDGLPVIIELKRGESKETPLRGIVESLAYAIAVEKIWESKKSHFRDEWEQAIVPRLGPVSLPARLAKRTIVFLAEDAYWRRCRAEHDSRGAIPHAGWHKLDEVLRQLDRRGFGVLLACLEKRERHRPCAYTIPCASDSEEELI
jgi:hypothetical protein